MNRLADTGTATVEDRVPITLEQLWCRRQSWLAASLQRLWFSITVPAGIGREGVATAIHRLINRHEVLRSTYAADTNQPEQIVLVVTPETIPLSVVADIDGWARAQTTRALSHDDLWSRFGYQHGPGGTGGTLFAVVEGPAADCWSMALLREQLLALLHGESDAGPFEGLQYGDYAHWQRDCAASGYMEASVGYWVGRLEHSRRPRYPKFSAVAVTSALDRFRMAESVGFAVGGSALGRLREAVAATRTSVYMMAATAVYIVIGELCGGQRVLIETVAANRTSTESEGIVGPFSTPLFLDVDTTGSASIVLARVRDMILETQDHVDGHPSAVIAAAPSLSWLAEPTAGLMVRLQFVPASDPSAKSWAEPLVIERDELPADVQIILSDTSSSVAGVVHLGSMFARVLPAGQLIQRLRGALESLSEPHFGEHEPNNLTPDNAMSA